MLPHQTNSSPLAYEAKPRPSSPNEQSITKKAPSTPPWLLHRLPLPALLYRCGGTLRSSARIVHTAPNWALLSTPSPLRTQCPRALYRCRDNDPASRQTPRRLRQQSQQSHCSLSRPSEKIARGTFRKPRCRSRRDPYNRPQQCRWSLQPLHPLENPFQPWKETGGQIGQGDRRYLWQL